MGIDDGINANTRRPHDLKKNGFSFGSLLAYSYLCSQINHLTLTRYEENHYIFIQTGGGDAARDDAHDCNGVGDGQNAFG